MENDYFMEQNIEKKESSLHEFMSFSVSDGTGICQVDFECKTSNINTFLHIDREGLKNGELEKRLIMYKTFLEETIYIEYPGKESTKEYESKELKNMMNPNDFRPELHLPDGSITAKLSFVDISEALVEYAWTHDIATMQMLAAMIIRLAFMREYKKVKLVHPSQLIRYVGKTPIEEPIENKDVIERYFLPINSELKSILAMWDKINLPSRHHEKKLEVSIEGFLYYLDILAQQEDCKYYYTRKSKGQKSIDIGIGRINNLLTVVNVIDRLITNRPYGDIIGSMGRYVRPIKRSEFERVTGGLVTITTMVDNITEIVLD